MIFVVLGLCKRLFVFLLYNFFKTKIVASYTKTNTNNKMRGLCFKPPTIRPCKSPCIAR